MRLVQGNVGFIARFPVYLPFTNRPTGAVVPTTKNDAGMYDAGGFYATSGLGSAKVASGEWSPFECGSACYNATHYLWCGRARANMRRPPAPTLPALNLSNLSPARPSARGARCIASPRSPCLTPPRSSFLAPPCRRRPCLPPGRRGITSSALDFVELLKVSGLQSLDRRNYDYRLVKLANATTGDTTWVSGVNMTFEVATTREVAGLTFILELHPREGVYPIWCALFLL